MAIPDHGFASVKTDGPGRSLLGELDRFLVLHFEIGGQILSPGADRLALLSPPGTYDLGLVRHGVLESRQPVMRSSGKDSWHANRQDNEAERRDLDGGKEGR